MVDTQELKNCPFCNSAAELCRDEIVQCSNNLCQVARYTIEAWNTRAEPMQGVYLDRIQELKEQLTQTQQALDSAVEHLEKLLPLARKAITGSYLDDARCSFKEFVESPRQVVSEAQAALASIKEAKCQK